MQVLERQNLQNQMNSKLSTDDSKSKYSTNSKKKEKKNFTPRRQIPKLLLLNFLAKFLTKKISNKQFNLCQSNVSLHGIKKSVNSQTNNKSPSNDGLTIVL